MLQYCGDEVALQDHVSGLRIVRCEGTDGDDHLLLDLGDRRCEECEEGLEGTLLRYEHLEEHLARMEGMGLRHGDDARAREDVRKRLECLKLSPRQRTVGKQKCT